MARANLALACEHAGDPDRARLAARQALAIPVIPGAAAEQARALLARLPDAPGLLAAVLAGEPADGRPTVLRDEAARWTGGAETERRQGVAEWLAALDRWPLPDELAGQWLGVLLELPPDELAAVCAATAGELARLPRTEGERLQAVLDRAMARFPPPQWERLRRIFARDSASAAEHGGA